MKTDVLWSHVRVVVQARGVGSASQEGRYYVVT